jgi:YggT family protein
MLFIYRFLDLLLTVLWIAILARVLISWFDPMFKNSFSRILHDVTEPILGPIRSMLPRTGMVDLSPIVAFLIIWILQQWLLPRAFFGF